MWLTKSEDLLISWNNLRSDNCHNPIEDALLNVNDYWQLAPMDLHYLHWDTPETWPSPWDLLADGIFCDLAKALGISYTLLLMNRPEINDLQLAQTKDGDNLVLVNQGKYILNWAPGEMLNITSDKIRIQRTMQSHEFDFKIN